MILDNLSRHKVPTDCLFYFLYILITHMWLQVPADEGKANILIIFLSPNTTSHLQPCGQGIIAMLKAFNRHLYYQGLVTWLEAHLTPGSHIITTSLVDKIPSYANNPIP